MSSCSTCGTTILFGGAKDGDRRYCNAKCKSRDVLVIKALELPDELVERAVKDVLDGECPVCSGGGPVDVFSAHKVTSMVVLTRWKSEPRISCRGCATKAQLGAILHSALLGWWGFPWGLALTPVQIGKNLVGLTREAKPTPSRHLEGLVRARLAAEALSAGTLSQAA